MSVYVNDALLISATDSDPVPSGSIELETKPRAQVQFDDIEVVADVPCEHTWTRTETFPVGGDINVIAVDPKDSNVVYAGTEHMGFWRSTDGGVTWAEVGYSGDMGRLGKTRDIAIAPSDTSVLYVSWGDGEVNKSTDRGVHWSRTGLMDTRVRVNALAVSPSDPDVVFAALGTSSGSPSSQGIFKSSDGGDNWSQLAFDAAALSIVISASSPDTLYAGSTDGIYRSTNGGTSWTKVYTGAKSGAISGGVRSIAIDPTTPNTVYAVADAAVKTTDGGTSWTTVRTAEGTQVIVAPSNPAVVYLLQGTSILKSADRGGTWSVTPAWTIAASSVTTIAVDSSSSDKIYAGTWGQGVFVSLDSGATWAKPATALVPADLGAAIAVDPTNSSRLYVGTAKGEVYVSSNRGASWTKLANLGTGGAQKSLITGLVVDPLDPKIIYASNIEGLYKSKDGGSTWTTITTGLTDTRVISLAIDPKSPDRVFAGTGSGRPRNISEGSGLFYSTNGGESWSKAQGLPEAPVPAIVISPRNTSIMYAAVMTAGVYKSVNGGTSWSEVSSGFEDLCVYTLAIDPQDPNVAYAGTTGSSTYCKTFSGKADHVYKTVNGGTTGRSYWKARTSTTQLRRSQLTHPTPRTSTLPTTPKRCGSPRTPVRPGGGRTTV